jgi:Dimerisation and cyclophilin-binding domain of Mon2
LTQTTIAWLSRASCTSILIQDDLSRQMTGIREHLLRPVFMGCSTKKAKVIIIALGSLQRLIALRAAVSVEFSGIPAYHPSNERPLVARCRLGHVLPESPLPDHQLSHYSWQTTRKRTCFRHVLSLLFLQLTDGPPALLFKTVLSCMNLGGLLRRPRRQ